jgi:hypothetical protein
MTLCMIQWDIATGMVQKAMGDLVKSLRCTPLGGAI